MKNTQSDTEVNACDKCKVTFAKKASHIKIALLLNVLPDQFKISFFTLPNRLFTGKSKLYVNNVFNKLIYV